MSLAGIRRNRRCRPDRSATHTGAALRSGACRWRALLRHRGVARRGRHPAGRRLRRPGGCWALAPTGGAGPAAVLGALEIICAGTGRRDLAAPASCMALRRPGLCPVPAGGGAQRLGWPRSRRRGSRCSRRRTVWISLFARCCSARNQETRRPGQAPSLVDGGVEEAWGFAPPTAGPVHLVRPGAGGAHAAVAGAACPGGRRRRGSSSAVSPPPTEQPDEVAAQSPFCNVIWSVDNAARYPGATEVRLAVPDRYDRLFGAAPAHPPTAPLAPLPGGAPALAWLRWGWRSAGGRWRARAPASATPAAGGVRRRGVARPGRSGSAPVRLVAWRSAVGG